MNTKYPNGSKHWTPDDDALLVGLMKRHVMPKEISRLLGRPVGGINRRLNTEHKEAYAASGHPSYQPQKAAWREIKAKTRVQGDADLSVLVAELIARVSRLETELGMGAA